MALKRILVFYIYNMNSLDSSLNVLCRSYIILSAHIYLFNPSGQLFLILECDEYFLIAP